MNEFILYIKLTILVETTDLVEEGYGNYWYDLACISRPTIEAFELRFDPDNKLTN